MYVQLPTVQHDCTSEAGELEFELPENVGPRSSVAIVVRNEGSAKAWLRFDETDALPSALQIQPDDVSVSFGPYRADSLPKLYGALGADCFVTLLVEGR